MVKRYSIYQNLISLSDYFVVVAETANFYTNDGATVTLVCSSRDSSSVTWTGVYLNMTYTSASTVNPEFPTELKNRLRVVGDHDIGEYNLMITNVIVTDDGLCYCTVKYNKAVPSTWFIHLYISKNSITT